MIEKWLRKGAKAGEGEGMFHLDEAEQAKYLRLAVANLEIEELEYWTWSGLVWKDSTSTVRLHGTLTHAMRPVRIVYDDPLPDGVVLA